MSITTFLIPPRLIFGRGSFSQLGLEAARLGRKALIVTGRHSAKSWGYLDQAVEILGEVDIASVVFAEVEQDPSLDTVERGAELAKSQGCDFVLGLGGGSPLDAAKAIA